MPLVCDLPFWCQIYMKQEDQQLYYYSSSGTTKYNWLFYACIYRAFVHKGPHSAWSVSKHNNRKV
jgi:hypothetical protein